MTVSETLTVLFNEFIAGLTIYGIGMSLAYAGYIGQTCDPLTVNEIRKL